MKKEMGKKDKEKIRKKYVLNSEIYEKYFENKITIFDCENIEALIDSFMNKLQNISQIGKLFGYRRQEKSTLFFYQNPRYVMCYSFPEFMDLEERAENIKEKLAEMVCKSSDPGGFKIMDYSIGKLERNLFYFLIEASYSGVGGQPRLI